jgi:hypothetical protein
MTYQAWPSGDIPVLPGEDITDASIIFWERYADVPIIALEDIRCDACKISIIWVY